MVGDICCAIDGKVLPCCDRVTTHLLNDLQSGKLHRSVKPPIFSCFRDIDLAIGENFEKYTQHVIQMMRSATEMVAKMDPNDEKMVDYDNQLRCNIFEAYSSILHGFKETNVDVMLPHAPHLLEFIKIVSRDQRDESVMKAVVAVLGDLADVLGSNITMNPNVTNK